MAKVKEDNSTPSRIVNAIKAFQEAEAINFNELVLTLWKGKILIFIVAGIFASGSYFYLDKLPITYQSQVTLDINQNVYSNVGISEIRITQKRLDSPEFKADLAKVSGVSSEKINASIIYSKHDASIIVYAKSSNVGLAELSVKLVAEHIDSALKLNELRRLHHSLDSTKSIKFVEWGDETKNSIGNIRAIQLYRIAVLSNDETNVVVPFALDSIQEHKTSRKNASIIALFTVLGMFLGAIVVLLRTMYGRFS